MTPPLRKTGYQFMQGSEACVEGAIAAGCRFFAGYPITPASEAVEHMARRLPQVKGFFVQMEDELASMGAVIGASWGGTKSMTATSGPGFSLMQENIGMAVMSETPCVIMDVMRGGPSGGQATQPSQGDVMQSRWGTHGDHPIIVLCPNSVQEMFDLSVEAFNLSERFRSPVILLSEEATAHLRENLYIPEEVNVQPRRKQTLTPAEAGPLWLAGNDGVPLMPDVGTGYSVSVEQNVHDEYGAMQASDPEIADRLLKRLHRKVMDHIDEFARVEERYMDGARAAVIAYGCVSRSALAAVKRMRSKGLPVGLLRPITLWPFPEEWILRAVDETHTLIIPEMNLGQLVLEVERVVKERARLIRLSKLGGAIPTPTEIMEVVEEALSRP